MISLDKVEARLRIDEGVRTKPYVDTTGNVTIGVGHNLTSLGLPDNVIELLLQEDIDVALKDIENYPWFSGLSDNRQLALICMMFNLGPSRFAGFKDMLNFISAQNWNMAAAEMLQSQWAKQVGQRAQVYAQLMRGG